MRPIAILFFCVVLLANLSCSVNILENFADKTTNEALYNDAKMLINDGLYTAALAKMNLMTGSFAVSRRVVSLKAQAHAGICGLDFFGFVLALRNLGTQRLLPFLAGHFRSGAATTAIDHCMLAEDLVESIGAVGARTTDENFLLALISFAKIGNLLSYYADADQDGTPTPTYDVCAIGGGRTAGAAMPDSDARELGTGITLAAENITALAGQVDLGSDLMTDINGACSDLGPFNFCSKTDPTTFDANELLAIRSLAKEGSAVGLNLDGCGGGDVTVGACRCF